MKLVVFSILNKFHLSPQFLLLSPVAYYNITCLLIGLKPYFLLHILIQQTIVKKLLLVICQKLPTIPLLLDIWWKSFSGDSVLSDKIFCSIPRFLTFSNKFRWLFNLYLEKKKNTEIYWKIRKRGIDQKFLSERTNRPLEKLFHGCSFWVRRTSCGAIFSICSKKTFKVTNWW